VAFNLFNHDIIITTTTTTLMIMIIIIILIIVVCGVLYDAISIKTIQNLMVR
jgi:hypothetical protein